MRFGAALDLWHKGDLHLEEPDINGIKQGIRTSATMALLKSNFTAAVRMFPAFEAEFISVKDERKQKLTLKTERVLQQVADESQYQ